MDGDCICFVKGISTINTLNTGLSTEIQGKALVMSKKITFIDLFSGIGGFRLAFERNGAKCLFASEIDEHCQKTYFTNFGEIPRADIRQIESDDIPDHDILCAGFPCQTFSIMGDKKGFDDSRGNLFFELTRILKEKQPQAFLLENVEGLISHDNQKTMLKILSLLHECGYNTKIKVFNSKHFGVPQNRKRVYFVGFKDFYRCQKFMWPTPNFDEVAIKDILEKEVVDEKYYLSKKRWQSEKRKREYLKQLSKNSGYTAQLRSLNDIALTITATSGSVSRNVIIDKRIKKLPDDKNPEFVRRFTPREYARLQGFSENFKIVVSDTQAYKQFGNAVTVPVIQTIAKKIIESLR